jgi:hypothetical protein
MFALSNAPIAGPAMAQRYLDNGSKIVKTAPRQGAVRNGGQPGLRPAPGKAGLPARLTRSADRSGNGGEQPLSHASELTRPAVRGRLRVYLITVTAIRVRSRAASGAQPLRVQRVVRRNVVPRANAGVHHGCCQRGAPKHCSRVPRSRSPFTAARHAHYQLPGLSRERSSERPSCVSTAKCVSPLMARRKSPLLGYSCLVLTVRTEPPLARAWCTRKDSPSVTTTTARANC